MGIGNFTPEEHTKFFDDIIEKIREVGQKANTSSQTIEVAINVITEMGKALHPEKTVSDEDFVNQHYRFFDGLSNGVGIFLAILPNLETKLKFLRRFEYILLGSNPDLVEGAGSNKSLDLRNILEQVASDLLGEIKEEYPSVERPKGSKLH
jgi:hypothetical protein